MKVLPLKYTFSFLAVVLLAPVAGLLAAETASIPEMRSPVNQVFQFVQSGTCSSWTNGATTSATGYLWIPEDCQRLRGLLILCANVPEHMLVGHPAIRKVCAERDLGIFWGTPSFYNFQAKGENKTTVAFLQQLLDGLAQTSGYSEVATVPWLPMGESGHLLMVDALVEAAAQRCIAGIWIKNNHLPPQNCEVPALVAFGTAQEWSQDKSDIRQSWNNIGKAYDGILNQRKQNPKWPLSYVIDGTSGHFDCSERLTQYFAHYINLVAQARLRSDGSPTLNPVLLEHGYLADLPVPGHENRAVAKFSDPVPAARGVPWYFDLASAAEAQAIARINWNAGTQLPGFADEKGNVFPFTFNGITWLPINLLKGSEGKAATANRLPAPLLETEADGITFTIQGVLLDKIPSNFVGAGEPLAKAPGTPIIEWLCGCVEPLGNNKFRMALDRTWPSPIYIAVRHAGTGTIRAVVQPGQIARDQHSEGAPQKITFKKISDVKAGTKSIPLVARSDAGLPVKYFVVVGPAIVKDDRLVFTKIPPRTKYPVNVTVAAWQWGRGTDPKVRTAEIVKQSFQIIKP
ncbi:MAG: hypothetical protein WCH99_02040 [Verrucomicrobiota bacterium]